MPTYQRWYRTGTVALTNDSTDVTGTLTGWLADVRPGDAISTDGTRWAEIASIETNTGLTLAAPWNGATYSGPYVIDRRSLIRQMASDVGARINAYLDQAKLLPAPVALDAAKIPQVNADGTAFDLVTLTPAAVGLSNVNNTSDINKPVSSAALAASLRAAALANIVVNGSMVISQENGTTAVGTGAYPVDQWQVSYATAVGTGQQITTTPPDGYTHALRLAVTTPSSSGSFQAEQPIEGHRLSRLGVGSANARVSSIGFWVRSSLAQTVTLELRDSGGTARFTVSATISAANAWEFKSIAVPALTAGTWGAGTAKGGSLVVAPSSTWRNTNAATFDLTGVSWLPGVDGATAETAWLIQRQYDDELLLCQRYFERFPDAASQALSGLAVGQLTTSTTTRVILIYAVEKRSVPSLGAPVNVVIGASGYTETATGIANAFPGRKQAMLDYAHAAHGSPVGVVAILYAGNTNARQDINARM